MNKTLMLTNLEIKWTPRMREFLRIHILISDLQMEYFYHKLRQRRGGCIAEINQIDRLLKDVDREQ